MRFTKLAIAVQQHFQKNGKLKNANSNSVLFRFMQNVHRLFQLALDMAMVELVILNILKSFTSIDFEFYYKNSFKSLALSSDHATVRPDVVTLKLITRLFRYITIDKLVLIFVLYHGNHGFFFFESMVNISRHKMDHIKTKTIIQ